MGAVGRHLESELDVVVDDERHAALAAQLRKLDCFYAPHVSRSALAPVLEEGDAAFERRADLGEQLGAVAAVRRDRIETPQALLQFHLCAQKKRSGMRWPAPVAKAACSACQVYSCASRAASATCMPFASAAASAEASVQPEP